ARQIDWFDLKRDGNRSLSMTLGRYKGKAIGQYEIRYVKYHGDHYWKLTPTGDWQITPKQGTDHPHQGSQITPKQGTDHPPNEAIYAQNRRGGYLGGDLFQAPESQ